MTLAQDKPVTQSVARALRDNPIAITEGASGAPKVQSKALDVLHFKAYRTGGSFPTLSALGSTPMKLPLNEEEFDSDACYDTTNYRFTPNQAGFYVLQATVTLKATTSWSEPNEVGYDGGIFIRKNGSNIAKSILETSTNGQWRTHVLTVIAQANGSTDYFELWYDTGGNLGHSFECGANKTFFQGWNMSAV